MPNFKAQIERDIKDVFHNSGEFAEITDFWYKGTRYSLPVVIEYETARERSKSAHDYADGIFIADAKLYIAHSDLKVIPKQGNIITIADNEYRIVKAVNDMGEIILDLEMFDE